MCTRISAILVVASGLILSGQLVAQPLSVYQVRHSDLALATQREALAHTGPLREFVVPEPTSEFDKQEYRLQFGDETTDRPGTTAPHGAAVGVGLTVESAFESIDLATVGSLTGGLITPPDTMGAVGPTQFATIQNGAYRFHDKLTGAADLALDVDANVFWVASVDPNDNGGGDPRVRFDRLTDTWIVSAFELGPGQSLMNNRLLIAQSDSATITGATVWTQWFITPKDTVNGASETGCFADYPMLGVDVNAIYLGANMFPISGGCGSGGTNTAVFVLPKAQLPGAGGDASSVTTALTDLLQTAPIWSPMPADNYDPAATQGFVIGHHAGSDTNLRLGRISNPGGAPGAPSITWFDIPINNKNDGYGNGVPYPGVPAPNGTNLWGLDPVGFRPLGGAIVRNDRLWISMTSSVDGPAGNLVLFPGTGDRHSVVFFEIDVNTNSKVQEGNIYDSITGSSIEGADPFHLFMGSVAVNGQGHAAAVFTGNNTGSVAPSGYWAGRLASDPLGQFSEPASYFAGTDTGDMRQSFENDPRPTRWGDYAQATVDPCDDMTFFGIAEYQDTPAVMTGGNWATAVARISAPPPAFDSAMPNALPTGVGSTAVTVTGTGFYDPPMAGASACRIGLDVTTDFPNVSINDFSFVNAGQINLDLNTTGAADGLAEFTIVNPDGQEVVFQLVIGDAAFIEDGFETIPPP
jgi:hypothetical protein